MPTKKITWDDLYPSEQNRLWDLANNLLAAERASNASASEAERYQRSDRRYPKDFVISSLVVFGYHDLKRMYKNRQFRQYFENICEIRGCSTAAIDLHSFPQVVQLAYRGY